MANNHLDSEAVDPMSAKNIKKISQALASAYEILVREGVIGSPMYGAPLSQQMQPVIEAAITAFVSRMNKDS